MNLFLHFKPEVLPTFQKNYNFLHSQFEKIMKVLQSDLGKVQVIGLFILFE